jgi:hydrogenase maturation protease
VRAIADAVLYEGYILWPYRRSAMKNTQRWTFGGVYPRGHSEGREDDPWVMRTQCLVTGDGSVGAAARFLHVVRRQVERDGVPVDEAVAGGERHVTWDEATERELGPGAVAIEAGSSREDVGDGVSVVRSWQGLSGSIELASERLGRALRRVTVTIANTTPFAGAGREEALERTFCSCHTVLRAGEGAEFVSLTDPPPELRDEAASCRNEGTWPVLVGEPGDRSTLLSSPIILEDYPRIAPESPGDLFDGGEIDQMLVLNILSLTDEEKDEMRASDPRAREILERTEALTPEQLMQLNGRLSDLRMVK